jgi:hypothetical protein
MASERMMKWFVTSDLPQATQEISEKFLLLASELDAALEPGPERTVAFRKLLESRDAAVRAKLHPGG